MINVLQNNMQRLLELEQLAINIKIISGFGLEEVYNLMCKGYTLQKLTTLSFSDLGNLFREEKGG